MGDDQQRCPNCGYVGRMERAEGQEGAAFTFPRELVVGRKRRAYVVTAAAKAEHEAAYPGVDVPRQYRAMAAWLRSNPKRRKTHRGMGRFVNSWLARQQNQGGGKRRGRGREPPPGATEHPSEVQPGARVCPDCPWGRAHSERCVRLNRQNPQWPRPANDCPRLSRENE